MNANKNSTKITRRKAVAFKDVPDLSQQGDGGPATPATAPARPAPGGTVPPGRGSLAFRTPPTNTTTPPTTTPPPATTAKPPLTKNNPIKPAKGKIKNVAGLIRADGGNRPGGLREKIAEPLPAVIPLATLSGKPGWLANIAGMVDAEHQDKVLLAVDAVIDRGDLRMTPVELATLINEVGPIFNQIRPDGAPVPNPVTPEVALAQAMRASWVASDSLRTKLTADNVNAIRPIQAQALAKFLDDNPALVDHLRDTKVSYVFNSAAPKSHGEGLYIDGVIHLATMDAEGPDVFLRMWLHETGHGTFQRDLLPYSTMPDEQFPQAWAVGMIADLDSERTAYQDAADAATSDLQRTAYLQEVATRETQLGQLDADNQWAKFSPDAQTLYRAWTTLRDNNGQYLCGLELGPGRRPENRRAYQAGDVREFIAEAFMQVATGSLWTFLNDLDKDPNLPPDVRAEWENAARVLDKMVQQKIFGQESVFG